MIRAKRSEDPLITHGLPHAFWFAAATVPDGWKWYTPKLKLKDGERL